MNVTSQSDQKSELMESETEDEIRNAGVLDEKFGKINSQMSSQLQMELWVDSNNRFYETPARCRVYSDPTPTIKLGNLCPKQELDRCQSSCLERESSKFKVARLSVDQSTNTAVRTPQNSVVTVDSSSSDVTEWRSDVTTRITYTDQYLDGVFKRIIGNITAYNEQCELIKADVEYLVSDYEDLGGRVYHLEWENDTRLQEKLSDRILVINVPTKLKTERLKVLMIKIACKVGVELDRDDIADAYYLFQRRCISSPVVFIFVPHAVGARSRILDRKHQLQHIPMRTLGFPKKYWNKVSVDEQLIRKRHWIKQGARQEVERGRLVAFWVWRGSVFVRDTEYREYRVDSQETLSAIVEQRWW